MRAAHDRRPLLAGLLILAVGCAANSPTSPASSAGANQPALLRVQVLEVRPHDRSAFTQGFELVDGVLYEGTGLVGESSMRATDPATGQLLRRAELPAPLFGEGITVVDDRIWQLTWQDGVAIERDRATFAERRRVHYDGEGWGLCHDGQRLVMSDGSDRLTFRDATTFAVLGQVPVRRGGAPVSRLNELECTGGVVYANVWQTDQIMRIDPASGAVTAVIEAGGLLAADERVAADVLNGIAAIPATDEFLLTGKRWPHTYRVRFTP